MLNKCTLLTSCYDLTTGEVTVFQNFPFVGHDQHVPRYEENIKQHACVSISSEPLFDIGSDFLPTII